MKRSLHLVVVIVFCGAWMLYLRWDTQRFIESLPTAPSRTHIKQMPQESVSENENSPASPPESVSENNEPEDHILPDSAETPNTPDTRPTDPGAEEPVLGIDVEQKNQENLETQEDDGNDRHPAMDLTLEQIVENNRRRLIEQHGNIPEVDIYIRHMMPVFKGITEGKQQLTIQRTPEEALEYSRAQAVLFPSEKNLKSYQNVLEETQYLKRRNEMPRRP